MPTYLEAQRKMHAQTHISGQVPIQIGSQLSDLPQPNGNSIPSHIQSLGGPHNIYNMGPDFEVDRQRMRDQIYQIIQQRQQTTPEMQPRIRDISRRLEEYLYKNAATKEDYANVNTLEHRLQTSMRRLSSTNQSQQLPHSVSSSSSIGTMIPTPGMAQRGNFNSTISSSMDNSRSLLPTSNGSSGGMYGGAFSTSDGQMMPTPGLSSSNAIPNAFNSVGAFSGTDSTISQKLQMPKQYVGGHNSRILHNLGGQMGIGLRNSLQQKSLNYSFPNGTSNGVIGSIGNNVQVTHNPAASEGHLSASYGCSPASPRPSPSHFDHQRQQHLMQTAALSQQMIPLTADGYGTNTADLSGSEKLYGTRTSVGSTINSHNIHSVSMQSKLKPFSSLMACQSNLEATQQTTHIKLPDQSAKMNFQSHASQQQVPKFQQQELQQQPHLFQQQFSQYQQKQQSQNHQNLLLKSDEHRQPEVTPSLGSQAMDEQGMDSLR
ncbi:hypothetical protein IFM89_032839 [Coptis chinensis]|uniref:Uncharacterized protein n=1 Tax=Coptis chinensis TaxID=261450 RepID=A0A835II57_9MAGN|nr:hypothetical protein IFM89_032839 [Coptis chinensis]